MRLKDEHKELFTLLIKAGVDKQTAIGIIIEILELGKSCQPFLDWIRRINKTTSETARNKLDELYY